MAIDGGTGAASGPQRPIDVFISYARADVAKAIELETRLSGPPHNLNVWRDTQRLLPGEHIDFAIPEALREAKAVVTLWSETSAASRWVQDETTYAMFAAKSATLALKGFDYAKLSDRYRPLNCGDLQDIIDNPMPLLKRLDEIGKALKAIQPPKLLDIRQLPRASNRFIAREAELAMLRSAWTEQQPHVLVLVAAGGTGKTALSGAFLDEMAEAGWPFAEAVYAFSFDSQGTDEKRQGSSDRFFSECLTFFGEDPQRFDTVRKRAHRLADILEQRRVLLVLDGIEPMQSPRGDAENGRLRDDAMSDFLRDIAHDSKGLTVVTTRLPIPDLNSYRANQVRQIRLPNLPLSDAVTLLRTFDINFPQAELEALARDFGQIIGATKDDEGTVRCHAKAIALIGSYIAQTFAGATHRPTYPEVRLAFEMPDEAFLGPPDAELKQEPGYAVYKMIRRYEIMYEDRAKGSKKADVASAPGRQLALLRVMGLFDRPATWGAFKAVLAKPEIPVLTERLGEVTDEMWRKALIALRDDGLINPSPDGQTLLSDGHVIDAHPLVREYFGRRLKVVAPTAFRAAHSRLYDYYRFQGLPAAFRQPANYGALCLWCRQDANAKGAVAPIVEDIASGRAGADWKGLLPPSLFTASPDALREAITLIDGPDWKKALATFLPRDEQSMAPLFAAIAHGSAAGRHDEAFNEIYIARIARGNEGFAVHKLGLYGLDLASLAHFFAEPFGRPASVLSASDQALVLNQAGFALRALGRLSEAVEPFRGNLSKRIEQEAWKSVAIAASNLSELLSTLGRLRDDPASGEAGALSVAEQAVGYADRSGDSFQRMINRSTHADALRQAGRWAEAAQRYIESERLQREWQPQLPLLYSLRGYLYCDLKLAQGRAAEVSTRYHQFVAWRVQSDSLLDRALEELLGGRAEHLAQLKAFSDRLHAGGTGAQSPGRELGAHSGLLDSAVENLRQSGSTDDLPRGLLARAASHRDSGNDKLASKDLTEAFDIAERGGMRLFLADCWIESARQQLCPTTPDEGALIAAGRALNTAAQIIAETGYRRREPDLALVGAELALARSASPKLRQTAATPLIARLIELIREHNLWSYLPELERVAARFALHGLAPTFDDLRGERARFDAEADKTFEDARVIRRDDGLDDDAVDVRLADTGFRQQLIEALHRNGHDFHELLPREQREAARQFVVVLRNQAAKSEELYDEVIDIRLDDPAFRKPLVEAMRISGMPPLETLPLDQQRAYARKYIEQVEKRERPAQPAAATSGAPPPLPGELVDAMLSNESIRGLLEKIYRDNDVEESFDAIPREVHAGLLARLVADGVIDVGGGPDGGAGAAPAPSALLPSSPPATGSSAPGTGPTDDERRGNGILSRFFGGWMRRET